MSLKNIPLPAVVLANLYKNTLVEAPRNAVRSPLARNEPAFANGADKRILILVNTAAAEFLPVNDLKFLSGFLTACRLSMNDIAIVNLRGSDVFSGRDTPAFLSSEIIILF